MKADIHPDYHPNAKISCACGNTITTGSTAEKIEVELCSECHPFFTGKQKIVDTARRVEKFQARAEKKDTSKVKAKKTKTSKRKAKQDAK